MRVDFRGSRVTSDGGLILIRELDERLGFGELIEQYLTDGRRMRAWKIGSWHSRSASFTSPYPKADSRDVVRFYNKRGAAEQWVKEGKQAVKMTRLSCREGLGTGR